MVPTKEGTLWRTPPLSKVLHIPAGCDLYLVKHYGQVAIPEPCEQVFVEGFTRAFSPGVHRSYGLMVQKVIDEARARGYQFEANGEAGFTFQQLWKAICAIQPKHADTMQAARLYTDVFVSAVLRCLVTDQNEF